MPAFGERSQKNLDTCHHQLQLVANEAILHVDFSVIEGHRSLERQKKLFDEGRSKIDGISQQGKHNPDPSEAFDLLPYPAMVNGVNVWEDRDRFLLFAGFVKGIATSMGITLRLGADWDGDFSTADQTFHDLPHFEILL